MCEKHDPRSESFHPHITRSFCPAGHAAHYSQMHHRGRLGEAVIVQVCIMRWHVAVLDMIYFWYPPPFFSTDCHGVCSACLPACPLSPDHERFANKCKCAGLCFGPCTSRSSCSWCLFSGWRGRPPGCVPSTHPWCWPPRLRPPWRRPWRGSSWKPGRTWGGAGKDGA